MGIPDGAHTHGSGGGIGAAVVAVVAIALAVKVLPVVVGAVAELVHLVLIVAAVLAGIAAAAGAAYVAFRLRHRATEPARLVHRAHPVTQRRSQALPEPRPAIERSQEVHLHLHGVSAEDVAAIIEQGRRDG
jgi:hypothetical protein